MVFTLISVIKTCVCLSNYEQLGCPFSLVHLDDVI